MEKQELKKLLKKAYSKTEGRKTNIMRGIAALIFPGLGHLMKFAFIRAFFVVMAAAVTAGFTPLWVHLLVYLMQIVDAYR